MAKFQKIKTVKIGLWLLGVALLIMAVTEYTIPPRRGSFLLSQEQINDIKTSLIDVNQYNTYSPSVIKDMKAFFNGEYTSEVYSIKYHNILSILFLILVPFLMAFIAMFMLRVPVKYIGMMLAVFVFFTLFPLIFL